MSDMRYMNREHKKRLLRSNIVKLPRPEQTDYEDDEEDDEGYGEDDAEEEQQGGNRQKRILIVLLVTLAAAALFGWRYYRKRYEYMEYEVVWEMPMRYPDGEQEGEEDGIVSAGSFINYEPFADNMIKYTKDGASYIDGSGKTIWTRTYEMKAPIIYVNGDFAVIADQQGNDLYICDKGGCTGAAKTRLPITKAAVSSKGLAAVVVEDSTATYVNYYKKEGESLGIDIKMLLSGDGYPLDIALSPDGRQIAMSVMYIKNGAMKNKIVFYDFSEIGKNVNNRFIGAFEEEFHDGMVSRIRYLNADTVCTFSDKGISFLSVKNVIPDPQVITVPVEETIESICYSEQYAGIIVNNPSENPYRMDIYGSDGRQVCSFGFDYDYSGVKIDGDKVILYNEESCRVYNLDGYLKFEGRFDFTVSCVRNAKGRMNSLIVAGNEIMKEIRLR